MSFSVASGHGSLGSNRRASITALPQFALCLPGSLPLCALEGVAQHVLKMQRERKPSRDRSGSKVWSPDLSARIEPHTLLKRPTQPPVYMFEMGFECSGKARIVLADDVKPR